MNIKFNFIDAVMWLEDYLVKCKNTVVVVSHAREFLNVVCSDIIHFKDEKLEYYKGIYLYKYYLIVLIKSIYKNRKLWLIW